MTKYLTVAYFKPSLLTSTKRTYPQSMSILQSAPNSNSPITSIIAIHGLGTTSPKTWECRRDQAGTTQRPLVNWLSDHDMLPHVVPSANIFTFTWNSNYYENAPVVRILDVADILLSKLRSQRDRVSFIQL